MYPKTSTQTPRQARKPGALVLLAVVQLQQQHHNSEAFTVVDILNELSVLLGIFELALVTAVDETPVGS